MSPKKSDTPDASRSAGSPLVVLPDAGPPLPVYRKPWFEVGRANLPIPFLLLLLVPVSWAIESRGFGPYNQRIVMLTGFNILLAVSLQLINGFSGQFSLGHAGFMAVGAYLAAYPAITFSNRLNDPAASLLFFIGLGIALAIAGFALLGLFLLIRATRTVHRSLPMVFLVLWAIWLLVDFARAGTYPAGKLPPHVIWTHAINGLNRLYLWIVESGIAPAGRISSHLPVWSLKPLCFLILTTGAGICAAVV